MLDDWGSRFI